MTAEAGHAPNRIYIGQSGDLHLNGAKVYDVNELDITGSLTGLTASGADLNAAGALAFPASATISSAAGGSTGISVVTVQLTDGNSANIAVPTRFGCFLSDASPPTALTTTAASTGFNTPTAGFLDYSAAVTKSCPIVSDATGKAIFQITDSAKTAYYLNVVLPNGQIVTSPATLTYHS